MFLLFVLLSGVPIPIFPRIKHQGLPPSHSATLTALSCGCDAFSQGIEKTSLVTIYLLHEWLIASAYGIVNCLIVADSLSLPFSELLISLYAPACNLRCIYLPSWRYSIVCKKLTIIYRFGFICLHIQAKQ